MTNLEIEAFLTICRHKNISRAAEELYISQSSLSTRLKSLEEELGCTLLFRGKGTRELSLTPQGQRFYDLALQYQEITRKMKSVGKDSSVKKLRVSSISSVGNYLLPPVYECFAQKYPQIQLTVQDMRADQACQSIIRGDTDLTFTTANIQTELLISIPFLSDPVVILCSTDAPYPNTVDLNMLSVTDEVHINLGTDHEYWHHTVFGSDVLPPVRLEDASQFRLFSSEKKYWAIVPLSVADHLISTPGLRKCTPTFHIPHRIVYLVRSRNRVDSQPVEHFIDTLREVLSQQGLQGLLL